MARGGKRAGAGRPAGVVLPKAADKEAAGRILEAVNKPLEAGKKDSHEIERWRGLVDAQDLRIRLDALKYLYDKRDGKAVQPMDWGDKPISVVVDIPSAVTRRASQGKK